MLFNWNFFYNPFFPICSPYSNLATSAASIYRGVTELAEAASRNERPQLVPELSLPLPSIEVDVINADTDDVHSTVDHEPVYCSSAPITVVEIPTSSSDELDLALPDTDETVETVEQPAALPPAPTPAPNRRLVNPNEIVSLL